MPSATAQVTDFDELSRVVESSSRRAVALSLCSPMVGTCNLLDAFRLTSSPCPPGSNIAGLGKTDGII